MLNMMRYRFTSAHPEGIRDVGLQIRFRQAGCCMATVAIALLLFIAAGCDRSAGGDAQAPAHAADDPISAKLVGQSVNDFADQGLVNQEGESVSFESLPDKPVLLSFIYTRCPMKNMCPLITQKMRMVQERIGTDNKYPVRFVSITFDPRYDTPEVLREYGERRSVDYRNWAFWTGDPQTIKKLADRFAIHTTRQGEVIGHNMRTYILDEDHTIRYVYRRSDWPVEEVVRVLRRLAGSTKPQA